MRDLPRCAWSPGFGTRFALDFAFGESPCAENSGSGRALRALNFAGAKLACADACGVGYDNFGYGRALHALNLADAKLACAEIQRGSLPAA